MVLKSPKFVKQGKLLFNTPIKTAGEIRYACLDSSGGLRLNGAMLMSNYLGSYMAPIVSECPPTKESPKNKSPSTKNSNLFFLAKVLIALFVFCPQMLPPVLEAMCRIPALWWSKSLHATFVHPLIPFQLKALLCKYMDLAIIHLPE